jgi:hypothetical protein
MAGKSFVRRAVRALFLFFIGFARVAMRVALHRARPLRRAGVRGTGPRSGVQRGESA